MEGGGNLDAPVEGVNASVPFSLPQVDKGGANAKGAFKRRRACRFNGKDVDTTIYDGEKVLAGNVITGPAIIERDDDDRSHPEAFVSVDKYKNYIPTRR
jgi:N-methylhydantoinase A/oxoprolinase/acetone carboxylase beta subunit